MSDKQLPGKTSPTVYAAMLGILIIAAAVYFYAGTRHQPVSDEAIFARGGQAILDGDWSLSHWRVMKPFMVYYAQASSRAVFGASPLAGRIPGIIATLVCLVLLFRIGRQWFDEYVGLTAAALMALSPLVLILYPTGRTDALSFVCIMAAIDLAGRRRMGWAGFAYALGFCARQLSALSFPLVLALMLLTVHLDRDGAKSFLRPAWSATWRFFKGTWLPLAVLLAWSIFEKLPFAWLINEFQNKKYSQGAHLELSFGEKFSYWLSHSAQGLFDFVPLSIVALAIPPLLMLGLFFTRARGHWTARERPAMGALLIFSTFTVCFYLINSLRFFTIYQRFLVPVVPWLFLMFSIALVGAVRLATRRALLWRLAPPLLVGLGLSATVVLGTLDTLQKQAAPIPEDDIPRVARWIAAHADPGALLLTRSYGAEGEWATYKTDVKSKQIHGQLEQLADIAAQHLGRAQFLYLDRQEQAEWAGKLTTQLAPLFDLRPVAPEATKSGALYQLAVTGVGGLAGDQATYVQDGQLITEPLSCELLGALLQESFAGPTGRRPGMFILSHCLPVAAPDMLAWDVERFYLNEMRIGRAQFSYRKPQLDWAALLTTRKLVIRGAESGTAVFHLDLASLAQYIQSKNRNLENVAVAVQDGALSVVADGKLWFWKKRVEVRGLPTISGNQLRFVLNYAAVGGKPLTGFILRYAEKVMNPIMEIDLQNWDLRPIGISLLSRDLLGQDAVLLSAEAKN